MRRLNLLGVNVPLLMGTTFFSEYETPIWTLIGAFIGAIIGFGLSILWSYYHERKEHKARMNESIERIKNSVHLVNSQQAIQHINDHLPQFSEEEQINILSTVGFESALNNDEVTKFIIQRLRDICNLYELESNGEISFTTKSPKDEKKVRLVLSALWEISYNIIEYRRSEESVCDAFNLVQILVLYSIKKGYEKVVLDSIKFYRQMGELSDRKPNFEFGITESIDRLTFLKEAISDLKSEKITVDMLLEEANQAIDFIVKERDSKLNN